MSYSEHPHKDIKSNVCFCTHNIEHLSQHPAACMKVMDSCRVDVENIFLLVIITLISVLQNGKEKIFYSKK